MINFTSNFQLNSVNAGDKSISHRALILAAIADGPSVIRNLSLCQDVLATAQCLRVLGAQVEICGTTAKVTPISRPQSNVTLNCGNSGTTARLLAGLVAGLNVNATFYGDESLQKRPMQRVLEPLIQLGAQCQHVDGALFKISPAPLLGANIKAQYNSAQVKSAVLIAGLFANGATTYVENIPTRNHTENLLQHTGASISVDGNSITVAKSTVRAFDVTVPNDFSSAAYLLALALLTKQNFVYKDVCINPLRTGFLRVLENSGAHFVLTNKRLCFGEQVADVEVFADSLYGCGNVLQALNATAQDVCDCIDEVPILATMALTVKGKHRFSGVSELRYKECDRIQAILEMAKVVGQNALFDGNDLTIESNGILPPHPNFDGMDDHRMAMCQTVLSLYCGGGSVINENFAVSFPNFLQALGVTPLRFALVGEKIQHSMSPLLMRHLATQANVCCAYNLLPLTSNADDQTLYTALDALDGANVTMPFKTRVAQITSSSLVSVNTVGKNIAPTSTDGYGLIKSLQENNVDFLNMPLWIVGAGGAAEACVQTLLQYGCQMQIINRTAVHADVLTDRYNLSTNVQNPVGVLSFVPACEYEQSIVLPESVRFVFVADYKNVSGLELQAKRRGIQFVSGLQMLYHQGAKSFALWTNTEIQTDFESFIREIQK